MTKSVKGIKQPHKSFLIVASMVFILFVILFPCLFILPYPDSGEGYAINVIMSILIVPIFGGFCGTLVLEYMVYGLVIAPPLF
jgi:hypothetical protein